MNKTLKKIQILILLIFLSLMSKAQEKVIEGVVMDTLTRERLPYVAISIRNVNDSVVKFVYSNDVGAFSISYNFNTEGSIYFNMFGYLTKKINLNRYEKQYNNYNILLNVDVKTLDEVLIIGKSSDVHKKFDRTVYKITDEKKANAIDVYDILKTLPGVVVDETNKTIRFRGGEPEVLVGEMPSMYIYPKLEMIPIEQIENIELIDRSAMYGGEGIGGIINIKLKKIKQDGLGAFLSIFPVLVLPDKENLETEYFCNVNYLIGPFLFFNNLSYTTIIERNKSITQGTITNENLTYNKDNNLKSINNKKNLENVCGLLIPGEKTQIVLGYVMQTEDLAITNTAEKNITLNNNFTDKVLINSLEKSDDNNSGFLLYFSNTFKKNRQLNFNYLYGNGSSNTSGDYSDYYEYFNGIFADTTSIYSTENKFKGKTNKFDLFYNHPFNNDSARFNISGNYYFDKFPGTIFRYYILNNEYLPYYKKMISNETNANLSSNIGKVIGKFKLDGGFNYVYNQLKAEAIRNINNKDSIIPIGIENHFISPSARIAYTLNKYNELKIGYSLTNKLAGADAYIPYTDKQNPFNWVSGNPYLKPSYYNNLYGAYSLIKDSINFVTEIFYRKTNNGITNVNYPVSPVLTLTRPENMAINQMFGTDISFWYRLNKNWTFSTNTTISHTYFNAGKLKDISNGLNLNEENIIRRQFGGDTYVKIRYANKRKFKAGVVINYKTNEITFTGYNKSYFNMDYFIGKRFFNDKLFILVNFNNLCYGLMNRASKEEYLGINTTTKYYNTADKTSIALYVTYAIRYGDRGTSEIKANN